MQIGDYVIIRDDRAGVFAGTLAAKEGREITLTDARRLWYWSGAASLSQLAREGVKDPAGCKFPCEVSEVTLYLVIESLATTDRSRKSIAEVPVWER